MSFVFPNSGGAYDFENAQQAYDDIASRGDVWQNQSRANFYHSVLNSVLDPDVQFVGESETILEDRLEEGYGIALAFNHAKAIDPVHIAAMASKEPSFEPMVGHTMIGAKVGIHKAPVVGGIVPDLGSIPLWRKPSDVVKDPKELDESELSSIKIQLNETNTSFIRLMQLGMERGHHMVQFAEGTRNREDPLKIQDVRSGFGRVVAGVEKPIWYGVGAIYYGDEDNGTWRKPTMVVDLDLDSQARETPQQVKEVIMPKMQKALDTAVSHHDGKELVSK